jgi:hypothetical protein
MKKMILYAFVVAIAFVSANSQTMRIERTDVDTARYGHITANFKFGLDVYVDDLENVNSASFQLQWNFGDYVHFSGYSIGDFGDNGTVYITPPKSIAGTGSKYINVGIFSGTTVGENDFDSPKLLHLEFIVSNNIPNRESLVFNFVNFFATAYVDSSQTNVEIKSEPLELAIHGFINVWPGDSNNDGLVDTRDYNQIGLYFEGNYIQGNGRTFKRKNASIMWTGQKVLVWDNADATFADCDGDGVITVADGMVVFHNDSKTHPDATGLSEESGSGGLKGEIDESAYSKVPIFSAVGGDYRAITARATIPNGLKVKAVVPGDLFAGTEALVLKEIKGNSLEMTIGTFDRAFSVSQPGIIAYMLVENNVKVESPITLEKATTLNSDNNLEVAEVATDVEDGASTGVAVSYDEDKLNVSLGSVANEVTLYDLNGRVRKHSGDKSLHYSFENDLDTGTYLLMIRGSKVSIKTIQIIN